MEYNFNKSLFGFLIYLCDFNYEQIYGQHNFTNILERDDYRKVHKIVHFIYGTIMQGALKRHLFFVCL